MPPARPRIPARPKSPEALMLLGVSALLYLACLPLNALCVAGSCHDWQSLVVLCLGWFELLAIGQVSPVVSLAWLANPLLLVTWVLLLARYWRAAAVSGGVAALLALAFCAGTTIMVSDSGGPATITGHPLGYWLWVLSTLCAAAAGVVGVTSAADVVPRRR